MTEAGFSPDPAFEAGSIFVADWPLSHVRLQDDARWPWLVLIPRRSGLREVENLAADERAMLIEEIVRAGAAVRRIGEAWGVAVEKLNVGALGNVTPQLHVHVLGRRIGDPAWPGPVWGLPGALPLGERASAAMRAVQSF